jgi:hypothetical protein
VLHPLKKKKKHFAQSAKMRGRNLFAKRTLEVVEDDARRGPFVANLLERARVMEVMAAFESNGRCTSKIFDPTNVAVVFSILRFASFGATLFL